MVYNPFGSMGNHNTAVAPAPAAPGSGSPSAVGNGMTQTQAQQSGQAAAAIPFYKAAKWHSELGDTFSNQAFGSTFKPQVPAYGWLAAEFLRVQASGGAGGNAVATADAPWNVIANLIIKNPSGRQLIACSGYDAYLVQRYSGMSLFAIENNSNSFSAVDASGNFTLNLPIWHEFGQYGRGVLPNTNQAATYKAEVTFAPSSAVYTTAPTTLPTLSGNIVLLSRLAPAAADLYGRGQITQPPLNGIYQEVSSQTKAVVNGHNTFFSDRTGNVIRLLLLIWRNATGSRSGAVSDGTFPAATSKLKVTWDTTVLYDTTIQEMQDLAYLKSGLVAPAGVLPILFTDDEDHLAVGEDGGQYIPTLGSTKLEIEWDSTASGGSFELVTVDIVSPDGGVGVTQ